MSEKRLRLQIDRWLLLVLWVITMALGGVPWSYQWYLLIAPAWHWYSIDRLTIIEDFGRGEIQLLIERTLPRGPILVTAEWELHEAHTNEQLCGTRTKRIVLEGTSAQLPLDVIVGCETAKFTGREVVVQGHFGLALPYGVEKTQVVTSPSFMLPSTWRTVP